MAAAEQFPNVTSFKVTIDQLGADTWESCSGYGIDFEDVPYTEQKNEMSNKPGRKNARDIVLTRRFRKDKDLYAWVKKIGEGKEDLRSGSIVCNDNAGQPLITFNFFNAWPKSWSGPALSQTASGNAPAMETIVLSVGSLELA